MSLDYPQTGITIPKRRGLRSTYRSLRFGANYSKEYALTIAYRQSPRRSFVGTIKSPLDDLVHRALFDDSHDWKLAYEIYVDVEQDDDGGYFPYATALAMGEPVAIIDLEANDSFEAWRQHSFTIEDCPRSLTRLFRQEGVILLDDRL